MGLPEADSNLRQKFIKRKFKKFLDFEFWS